MSIPCVNRWSCRQPSPSEATGRCFSWPAAQHLGRHVSPGLVWLEKKSISTSRSCWFLLVVVVVLAVDRWQLTVQLLVRLLVVLLVSGFCMLVAGCWCCCGSVWSIQPAKSQPTADENTPWCFPSPANEDFNRGSLEVSDAQRPSRIAQRPILSLKPGSVWAILGPEGLVLWWPAAVKVGIRASWRAWGNPWSLALGGPRLASLGECNGYPLPETIWVLHKTMDPD